MTVSNTSNKVIYSSSGISDFPFTFRIYKTTDLLVYVKTTATGDIVGPLTLDTDYNVTLDEVAPSAGTVTLIGDYEDLEAGYSIAIMRILPITQLIDFITNEQVPADTFEEGYDRAIMIIQQLQEQLSRAAGGDVFRATPFALPEPVALEIIGWNATATALVNYPYPTLLSQLANAYIYFVVPEDTLEAGTDKVGRFPIDFNGDIVEVLATVSTAPVGSTIIADVKKNGTSIWNTTPGNRVTIAEAANSGKQTSFDFPAVIQGDYLTMDIAQIGSTTPGTNLVVRVTIRKT